MNPTSSTIAVTSSSPVITVSLESVGVFTGICVSISVLGTLAVKLVNNLNNISSSIAQIKEDLKEHADNKEKIRDLDKRLDLHIQDYINRKDTVQMILGQLQERIDHKFNRLYYSMKDVEGYLQREGGTFRMREYYEHQVKPDHPPLNDLLEEK